MAKVKSIQQLQKAKEDAESKYRNCNSPYLLEKWNEATRAYNAAVIAANGSKPTPARQCSIF